MIWKKDACQADSGGPMICIVDGGYAVQYGLVSYGMDCGDEARVQFL